MKTFKFVTPWGPITLAAYSEASARQRITKIFGSCKGETKVIK